MGYFPNGTSAEIFMDQHCAHCANNRIRAGTEGESCPIMDAHMHGNYSQKEGEPLEMVLSTLIRRKGLDNECQMYFPRDPDRCTLTGDLFDG